MNSIVVMKQTIDTEESIVIQDNTICEKDINFIMNPYDEYAIEEAIRLKESFGGEVTVISVGPERSESSLRTALAMGADKAILVDNTGSASDESVMAKILARVIQDLPYDLILCGNVSIDYGSAQTGPRLAEELGIPQITMVTKLKIDGTHVQAERDAEGDLEVLESTLPILLTVQQGLNEPRYPTLPGIMKAKKKEIRHLPMSDLNLDSDELDMKVETLNLFLRPMKNEVRILQGDIVDQCKQLVELLHTEAKAV